MNYSDEVVEYYRKGYRRIFDNFLFSFEIYAADRLMLLRLCKSSLNELNRLNEKSLKQDKIVTTHLMRPYQDDWTRCEACYRASLGEMETIFSRHDSHDSFSKRLMDCKNDYQRLLKKEYLGI